MATGRRCPLVLVALDADQIRHAKRANGQRKRITHALLCGPYQAVDKRLLREMRLCVVEAGHKRPRLCGNTGLGRLQPEFAAVTAEMADRRLKTAAE